MLGESKHFDKVGNVNQEEVVIKVENSANSQAITNSSCCVLASIIASSTTAQINPNLGIIRDC